MNSSCSVAQVQLRYRFWMNPMCWLRMIPLCHCCCLRLNHLCQYQVDLRVRWVAKVQSSMVFLKFSATEGIFRLSLRKANVAERPCVFAQSRVWPSSDPQTHRSRLLLLYRWTSTLWCRSDLLPSVIKTNQRGLDSSSCSSLLELSSYKLYAYATPFMSRCSCPVSKA